MYSRPTIFKLGPDAPRIAVFPNYASYVICSAISPGRDICIIKMQKPFVLIVNNNLFDDGDIEAMNMRSIGRSVWYGGILYEQREIIRRA